ncbi:TIGR04338 family metallohydrolase [Tsukamurella asaccharolytica]|uniref:TIGR04338 family metallohydrolase n=1 Tax=Tsukamurella asaccharolytica TaxID=2592067 RepID=A0A5C5REB7_9ACTN|nr:TIGR04338 family metallohydrolase [Tsukamurella asaccharolytica]TWS20411.1 TIGR04338 family metallohydrolase [Tsukamurella asaccharolytica]
MARDAQRAAVYRAEELVRGLFEHAGAGRTVDVLGVSLTLPPEARFASVDAVQSYADRVLGPGAVRVRARAGAGGAHYESGPAGPVIAVPAGRDGAWALRELVVLHELAHHVVAAAGVDGAGIDGAAHGPSFTAAFVDLAARIMGPEAGLALRIVYTESGVAVG